MKKFAGCLLLMVAALYATGCQSHDPRFARRDSYMGGFHPGETPGRANFDNVSYWDGDGVSGSPSVRINLEEQRAYFYKGGELVGVSVISTGARRLRDAKRQLQDPAERSRSQIIAVRRLRRCGWEHHPEGDRHEEGSKAARRNLRWSENAVFHAHHRRSGNARRVPARVPRLTRVHPDARLHGRGVLQQPAGRYPGLDPLGIT